MTVVRSPRRRLRIRLQCVRSSNRRTFACVRRPAATAASSPSATALALSGSTTAPSPTSAYALCPRQLRRAAPCSARACVRALGSAWQCCATLTLCFVCASLAFRAQPAAARCTVHGVGVPLGTTRRARCRESMRAGGGRREPCAAWRVQANDFGGLVGIAAGGTGHVSVVGSTLTNIAVCAHCRVPSRVPAHRGSRPAATHRTRRAVPHGVGCEYPQYPTGVTPSARSTHSAVEYRRQTLRAGAAASFARRVVCRPSIAAGS
jgi:hypothetical protein